MSELAREPFKCSPALEEMRRQREADMIAKGRAGTRNRFARAALPAVYADMAATHRGINPNKIAQQIAARAFEIADAMMAESEKRS